MHFFKWPSKHSTFLYDVLFYAMDSRLWVFNHLSTFFAPRSVNHAYYYCRPTIMDWQPRMWAIIFTVFLSLIADLDFLVTTCVVGGYKWHVIYLIDLWRIFFINKIFWFSQPLKRNNFFKIWQEKIHNFFLGHWNF